jgi:uncharacterized membrane protein
LKREYFNIDKLFFAFLFAVVSLPILAPILSAIGFHSISKLIYFVYSFTCHQFASRSLFISDYQYAWCARDTGIWFGFLIAALLYKFGYLKKIKWYHFLIFLVPIAFDGGIQTLATIPNISVNGSLSTDIFYVSNNLFRFLTGAWFGIGLSLLLTPNIIQKEIRREEGESKQISKYSKSLRLGALMLFIFIIYFALVQIWSISSSEVKPANFLDSKPKIEETNFFVRRGYGECPTIDENDLFNFECFF